MRTVKNIYSGLLKILLCCAYLLLSLKGNSQQPTLKFIHYSTKDGLPSSQIYQTFQDSRGYLWFTSDHGLIRYNGYEFKIFSTEDGLTDNTVFKIFEDPQKKLWLLTFAGGISVFENEKIYAYKYNNLAKSEIKGSIPLGIYVDSAENVFVTCHQWGEFKIDRAGKVSHEFNFKVDNPFHQVFIDEHNANYLLVSVASYADIERPLKLYYKTKNNTDTVIIPAVKQRKVFAAKLSDNRILFSIANRIFEYHKNNVTEIAVLPNDIVYFMEDQRKRLWAGTPDGVFVFDDAHDLKKYNSYLKGKYVAHVFEDSEGGFWLSTINSGLYYLGNDQIKNFVFDQEDLSEPMLVTNDHKSSVYAGYWSGTIAKFENQNLKELNTSPLRDAITAFYYDTINSRLLVGSRVSGYLSNNHYLPFDKLTIPSIPLDFMRTTKGVIYSAGDRVVYKLKNDSISQVGSFNVRINSIFEVSNDVFLFGTNNGAYLFDERTQKLSLYCNQLKDVRVDDIEMFNHNYCFATRGKGLLLMQNNTCRWIGQMEGLPSNLIHKITVDNNTIWCATNNGISRIAFSDVPLFKYSISNINSKDGLASNEVHDLTILRDTLYAATGEGISVFNKKNNFFNAVAPQIYFTSLRINGTDTITSHYYRFPYWMNNIRIGFEALSYKSSGDINYRYLLSNNEDSINNITKNREAEFLSLNPGNYTFTVSAVNSSGIASVKPAVIHFVIQKPFWQEWWFRLLIVALIAVTVSALVRRYIKRIKRQEKIKTEFNKQLIQFEMKALRAQMNPHFIFNVMNSIQDYILKNDAVSAQKYLTKFARLVRLILDNSIKAEVVLQEELKAAQLYVELEQQRFENKFEFIMEVDEMVDAEQIVLPAMIIQPYLENGIKHGIRHLTANGKLILNIVKEGHHIIISIEDNGVGRTESAKRNLTNVRDHVSYGTVITSKRIDAYNRAFDSDISATVIDLTNENGEAIGTKILVSIPIRYKPLAES